MKASKKMKIWEITTAVLIALYFIYNISTGVKSAGWGLVVLIVALFVGFAFIAKEVEKEKSEEKYQARKSEMKESSKRFIENDMKQSGERMQNAREKKQNVANSLNEVKQKEEPKATKKDDIDYF